MTLIHVSGFGAIEQIVLELYVWVDGSVFPFPKIKVKVTRESSNDSFTAYKNAHRIDRATGSVNYEAFVGRTLEGAVHGLLTTFLADAQAHRPDEGYLESDFVWSAHEDF